MASLGAHSHEEKPELKNFKDELAKKAEKLVMEIFPQKIAELSQVLEGDMFNISDMSTLHSDLNLPTPVPLPEASNHEPIQQEEPLSKKRKRSDDESSPHEAVIKKRVADPGPMFQGTVCSNPKLIKVMQFIKPEIIQIVDGCSVLQMWIRLMIPKIEDGNNFGVGIQQGILEIVRKSEVSTSGYLKQMTTYFSARAKLLSKAAKYPYLEDYRRAVHEYDEEVFHSFKLLLKDVRDTYAAVYDAIIKNYQKLVKPRSSNTNSLY